MLTVEKLKKSVADLKKEIKEKSSKSKNLKPDKDLRTIRKKLKRAQRKLRILHPPASKEKAEEKAKTA